VLARDVVRLKPDVIVSFGVPLTLEIQWATHTIPVVVMISADPGDVGVTNIARPGGNITGIIGDVGWDIWGKRLELLKEAIPTLSHVSFLASQGAWEAVYKAAVAGPAISMGIVVLGSLPDTPMHEAEYRRLFAAMANERPDALVISDVSENLTNAPLIVQLCESARLPTIALSREYAFLGALMAYGYDSSDLFRHQARIIDQILKGANPGEIPIYRSTKFELIINLKAAKALSITIPPSLLARADELIE
jgi:putative ABC transport system substrate-binding protein